MRRKPHPDSSKSRDQGQIRSGRIDTEYENRAPSKMTTTVALKKKLRIGKHGPKGYKLQVEMNGEESAAIPNCASIFAAVDSHYWHKPKRPSFTLAQLRVRLTMTRTRR